MKRFLFIVFTLVCIGGIIRTIKGTNHPVVTSIELPEARVAKKLYFKDNMMHPGELSIVKVVVTQCSDSATLYKMGVASAITNRDIVFFFKSEERAPVLMQHDDDTGWDAAMDALLDSKYTAGYWGYGKLNMNK